MSPFAKMLFDIEIKGKKEGRKEGEIKGKMMLLKEAVKNMLESGETEEKIMKYMGISKEEIENIKASLVNM